MKKMYHRAFLASLITTSIITAQTGFKAEIDKNYNVHVDLGQLGEFPVQYIAKKIDKHAGSIAARYVKCGLKGALIPGSVIVSITSALLSKINPAFKEYASTASCTEDSELWLHLDAFSQSAKDLLVACAILFIPLYHRKIALSGALMGILLKLEQDIRANSDTIKHKISAVLTDFQKAQLKENDVPEL